MEGAGFFEGAEKLLEVWFAPSKTNGDLRSINRKGWDELLQLVKCQVISERHCKQMDGYLLSESSMYVTERRFILKTCGQTTLLSALDLLLQLARSVGFSEVENIFYSRKNLLKPGLQAVSHRSFEQEVETLDSRFSNGAAYILGRLNGDSWFLYTQDHDKPSDTPDQTLELLMTGLDKDVARNFYKDKYQNGGEVTRAVGIHELIPNADIDAHLFAPCGYSLNGIDGDVYYTIHVTPQAECSYASFETNVPKESYASMVTTVMSVFKPERLLCTLFTNKQSICLSPGMTFDKILGYKRVDNQMMQLNNEYELNLSVYVKDYS